MGRDRQPCVHILASGRHDTPYAGAASDPARRPHRHREGLIKGFSSRYGISRLARFEMFEDMPNAIPHEKQLKKWRRDWKPNLLEGSNPNWADLAERLGLKGANG